MAISDGDTLSHCKRHASGAPRLQPRSGTQTTYDEFIEVRHSRSLMRRRECHGQEDDPIPHLSCHGNHRLEPSFLGGWRAKKNMLRGMSPTRAKPLAVALTLLIFALDYFSPGDINASNFYVCVIVTLAWTQSTRWLWGGAAVVTVLSVVTLPMGAGPVGHPDITLQDWINRLITASMLMLTAGFAYIGIRMSRRLDANEQLIAESAARERAEKALLERNGVI